MKFTTHRIVEEATTTKIYSVLSFKEGLTLLGIGAFILLQLGVFVIIIWFVFIKGDDFDLLSFLGIILIYSVLLYFIYNFQLKGFVHDIRRKTFPIIELSKENITIRSINGKTYHTNYNNIREINGQRESYSILNNAPSIDTSELSVVILKKGKITIDIINTKYFWRTSNDAIHQDLKQKTQHIGHYLSEALEVPYFWKN